MKTKYRKLKNILVVLSDDKVQSNELLQLMENFCGEVVNDFSEIQGDISGKRIYVCGDIGKLTNVDTTLYVIKEFSCNYEHNLQANVIELGQVPIIIHNAGVYFRRLFNDDNYFDKVKTEHVFQNLTESTKPGKALRKGIYLTEISKEEDTDALHYRLLRCSSNLTGPTDNFRDTDHKIINTLNDAVKFTFQTETALNHVLAQIYENKIKEGTKPKESKAKIKAHSDKTKDMPKEGLIAFCTFYDKSNFEKLKPSETDRYDWCYKNISGLTRLHFKLKSSVNDDSLEKEFSVTLYPNSVFLIPLSTNRLYTHEIKPSILNIDRIPTRMGYVVRCSNTEALFMNNQTYIKEDGALIKLEPMTQSTMSDLRNSYFEENSTKNMVKYGKVHFSMNSGDYQKPIY